MKTSAEVADKIVTSINMMLLGDRSGIKPMIAKALDAYANEAIISIKRDFVQIAKAAAFEEAVRIAESSFCAGRTLDSKEDEMCCDHCGGVYEVGSKIRAKAREA